MAGDAWGRWCGAPDYATAGSAPLTGQAAGPRRQEGVAQEDDGVSKEMQYGVRAETTEIAPDSSNRGPEVPSGEDYSLASPGTR